MSIRSKMLLIVGLTAVGLIAAVVFTAHAMFKKEADRQELKSILTDARRARLALTNEISDPERDRRRLCRLGRHLCIRRGRGQRFRL